MLIVWAFKLIVTPPTLHSLSIYIYGYYPHHLSRTCDKLQTLSYKADEGF